MRAMDRTLCVLSVPIQTCDRRALSEAWYGALHAAQPAAASGTTLRLKTGGVADVPKRRFIEFTARQNSAARGGVSRQTSTARRFTSLEGQAAFASRRSSLARRIERTFLKAAHPARQSTFTLEDGRTRVHVMLRRLGRSVHLVALCTAAARLPVAQALAEIQRRLRARGVDLRTALTQQVV